MVNVQYSLWWKCNYETWIFARVTDIKETFWHQLTLDDIIKIVMKNTVFSVVTPCISERFRRFGGIFRLRQMSRSRSKSSKNAAEAAGKRSLSTLHSRCRVDLDWDNSCRVVSSWGRNLISEYFVTSNPWRRTCPWPIRILHSLLGTTTPPPSQWRRYALCLRQPCPSQQIEHGGLIVSVLHVLGSNYSTVVQKGGSPRFEVSTVLYYGTM
jgi:hypothetical protein